MSNGQALNQQFITRFGQDLLAFLRHRPGVDLESIDHATPEMDFDLGSQRENKRIHDRSGDRIFITALTGVAYVRTRPEGPKYKLRVGKISFPFKKLFLTNTAQAGKTLSLIVGYGAFVDFVVSNWDVLNTISGKDFATQATLAFIKAKTDLLTKLDVNLSTVAKESGGNLAALAGLDFAEQTTLALIKAKTDLLTNIPKEASDTPTTYNKTMTNPNAEYEQVLPNGTYQLTFYVRGGEVAYRYAWVTGKVAGPTAPYTEVPAEGIVFLDKLKLESKTLYFACGSAGKIMQIEVLT